MYCAGFGSLTVTHPLSTRCSSQEAVAPPCPRCDLPAFPLNERVHLDRPGREAGQQKRSAACREVVLW